MGKRPSLMCAMVFGMAASLVLTSWAETVGGGSGSGSGSGDGDGDGFARDSDGTLNNNASGILGSGSSSTRKEMAGAVARELAAPRWRLALLIHRWIGLRRIDFT